MDELLMRLRAAVCETFVFAVKAQGFHWNVTGPLFAQFHGLFGAIYEDAQGAVDGLAEQILTLGAPAPASVSELTALSTIAFGEIPGAAEMLQQLVDDNRVVLAALGSANEAAQAAGEAGLCNHLQGRIERHRKWAWQLEATISERERG